MEAANSSLSLPRRSELRRLKIALEFAAVAAIDIGDASSVAKVLQSFSLLRMRPTDQAGDAAGHGRRARLPTTVRKRHVTAAWVIS
jgi:hypothetical protein